MPRLVPAVLLVLALAGCGGDGDRLTLTTPRDAPPAEAERGGSAEPRATPERRPSSGPVTSAEIAVIGGWADALRRGDVGRAVRYFAIPSRVSNGGPPYELRSAAAVRFFNETLPCGAKLESTERMPRGFVLATFRLTERPGEGECGAGTGHQARTLFYLRRGKIVQWIRATDPEPPSEGPGGTTS